MHKAKLFSNGRSQAVRLPKAFRFPGTEVVMTRLGDAVVIQPLYRTWLEIYKAMQAMNDELPAREDLPPEDREAF